MVASCTADYSARLKALAPHPLPRIGTSGPRQYSLDLNQLTRLARVIGKARSEGNSLAPLTPFRLAVLSNSTVDLIVPTLVASAARHGVALEVYVPPYGQVAQEALIPDSRSTVGNPTPSCSRSTIAPCRSNSRSATRRIRRNRAGRHRLPAGAS